MSEYPLLDKYPRRNPQEVGPRLAVIPDALKEVYLSTLTNRALDRVADKHAFDPGQTAVMGNIADEILLKFLPVGELESALQKHLELEVGQARAVAEDLRQEIFKDVEKELNMSSVEQKEAPAPENKFANLPQVLKDALAKIKITDLVQTIGAKHQLHIDQIGKLSDEIENVFAEKIKVEDFTAVVQGSLAVDQAKAEALTKDVNEQIFLPIRQMMQKETETEKPVDKKAGIFEGKMGKLFRIPREEVELDPYNEPIEE